MRSHLNKKAGLELSTIAEIILLLIAAGLIIGIFSYAAGRASEKTSENLCRGLNVLRYGRIGGVVPVGRIDKGPVTINLAPRGCKTIDKKDLPGKNYEDHVNGLKEGAKAELRDMIAKCWWMWLEGKQPNMFDTSTVALSNKCFVCYTFSMKDGADLRIPEFIASLDYAYEAADSSSRCAPAGQGGMCMASCDKSSSFSKPVPSDRCKDNEKCCIAENSKDECVNKGGTCEPREGFVPYNKWSCKEGSCHVKKENFVSYLDYVQGTNGAAGGAGFLVYQNDLESIGLTTKNKYAVTLISPGNTPGWDTAAWGGGILAIPVVTWYTRGAFSWLLPLTSKIEGAAIAEFFSFKMLDKSGKLEGYNFIYVSEYDKVKDKCQVELGVDDK